MLVELWSFDKARNVIFEKKAVGSIEETQGRYNIKAIQRYQRTEKLSNSQKMSKTVTLR